MVALMTRKILWILLLNSKNVIARLATGVKDHGGKLIDADHVSMSKEAAELRAHHLNRKKPILKKSDDITSLLFPGASPVNYREGDSVPLFVELVESRKTQIPFDYYKMPVCQRPYIEEEQAKKNLGQHLTGKHSSQPLSYNISSKINQGCMPLCRVSIDAKGLKFLRKLVKGQYRVHFTLDGLPVLVRSTELNYAIRGYPLGFIDDKNKEVYLYNHLRFKIYYNMNESPHGVRVTGFDVIPVSIRHLDPVGGWDKETSTDTIPKIETCDPSKGPIVNQEDAFLPLRTGVAGDDFSVVYSYEVEWIESDVKWADRWDIYLMETPDNEIHYFAIVNSLMVALFLTCTVAIIMLRALKKDIADYNDINDLSTVEETGWKLLHGDVFRPPRRGRALLSVAVGTGMQIGTSVTLTLVASTLRLIHLMKKGQFLTSVVIFYVLSGSVAGFTSARIYKLFQGKAWKRTTFMTAVAFPGVLVGMFVLLNCSLAYRGAATAVSFMTILKIFALWVCVSTPLVFIGAFFGYKKEKIAVPTKTNQIARFIPESKNWLLQVPHSAILGGILPFGSLSVELSFIMGALWLHQIYYIMGFVLAVVFILSLSCATVSIVICYCQLCSEDYKWWWKSFFNTASTGVYLFLYSLWYLAIKLELVGVLPFMVYLTYMGMIAVAVGLWCGAVGMLSSLWFCQKIYGAVKVD